ncbi:hypothetical protein NKG94_37190 [Micromonospora sp. M12]
MTVSGPFGLLRVRAGDIAAPPELLPGESWNVTVPVRGVAPAISLAATATLTPCSPTPRAPPPRSSRSRPPRTVGRCRGCWCWLSSC